MAPESENSFSWEEFESEAKGIPSVWIPSALAILLKKACRIDLFPHSEELKRYLCNTVDIEIDKIKQERGPG